MDRQIDGCHSSVFDIRSFREVDCNTNHYLVVAKVMDQLSVSKQVMQEFDVERFNLKKLNKLEGNEQGHSFGKLR
jgi:hypothetical protein